MHCQYQLLIHHYYHDIQVKAHLRIKEFCFKFIQKALILWAEFQTNPQFETKLWPGIILQLTSCMIVIIIFVVFSKFILGPFDYVALEQFLTI